MLAIDTLCDVDGGSKSSPHNPTHTHRHTYGWIVIVVVGAIPKYCSSSAEQCGATQQIGIASGILFWSPNLIGETVIMVKVCGG